jgi:mycothiol synthase
MDTVNNRSLPPELSTYSWRAIKPDDIPAIQAMLAAASPVDRTEGGPTEARLRALLGMLGDQVHKNTLLALAPDGSVAAMVFMIVPPAEDERLAMFEGTVAVGHRGRGIGSFLLGRVEARAREEFSDAEGRLPRVIRTSCTGYQADRIRLFERHGFEPMRYSYKMRRDLSEPVQKTPLPAGLSWTQWKPALDPPLMDAFNEAFSEQWGLPRMNEESWRTFFTGVPQFRSDLTYLAMDYEKIAGFCINWVEEENEAKEGWIEAIGVSPSWRGRGIASAMLTQALAVFRAEGLERAALDVDTQNPTGALRLYEKHGFEVVKETIHFTRSL